MQGVHIRSNRVDDLESEKSYLGQATYGDPEDVEMERLIAVAGMVAEGVWRDRGATSRCWPDEMADPDCMSPTDWAGAGCEPGYPDDDLYIAAEKVEELLSGALFQKLTSLSRRLIEAESRQTEEAVLNVFAALGYLTQPAA